LLTAVIYDGRNFIGGIEHLDVTDRPVDTVLELKPAIDIDGTIELESGTSTTHVELSKLRIQLLADYPGNVGEYIWTELANVRQDGSFVLHSVLPVRWRLYVNGAPVFVKSVWLDDKVSSGYKFDLSSGPARTMKIVLSPNTGSIRGTAPGGMTVVYRDSDDRLTFREVKANKNGQFQITGLAPGRYRVAAGESQETIHDTDGEDITIREGETVTVALKAGNAIP
jgi:hypothetical protein